MVRKVRNKSGFTLIEVMIALAIFGVFIVSFMASQGYNVTDSSSMRAELKLKELVQAKVNEIIVAPPELTDALTLKATQGKFEKDEGFKYEITYKKFKVPDLDKIKGNEESSNEDDSAESAIEKKIFDNVAKNLETVLWQVQVKVINEVSGQEMVMSTWLLNDKAEIILETI
ncbi:type II secretion system protein J [Bacteriovorax sp. Seq25_V]|uniref:PulJ/GspJ family protein n=1 Tax=Bacteriovorax sp. Seq25_V TaxID=1201288 RepID=UPI00038A2F95|nr:prepilin-type N-terminal cleavage/methylation domain-containing protein [Bacteriovorax sp. Seq25_V]EQC46122.1 prepilin-type cleavage/methylation N-terminal domain protein [Bacteriovorax sp. Seq25_V]